MGERLRTAHAAAPGPRSRQGRRHPVAAMLAQASMAMLEGANSLLAIDQWGREQPSAVVAALGYTRPRTAGLGTRQALFARPNDAVVEAVLSGWAQESLGKDDRASAIDGNAVRGTFGEGQPGLMLIAADTHETGLVLAHAGGPAR